MKKILLVIPIFILAFVQFFHPITDLSQDLGRHLLLGKIILQTGVVPKVNLLSYTYPTFPFINTHWMSEVIFFLITKYVGLQGLLLFMPLVAGASFALIALYSLKRLAYSTVFLSTLIYLIILLERVYLRPEIFSCLFISIFIVILYKNRERYTRWIFFLPLIELLWVNMHIYFPIGILLIMLFLIESVFFTLPNTRSKVSLSVVLLLCSLATFINPNGFQGAFYPIHIFSNYGYTIEENQTLLFLQQYGIWPIWFSVFTITSIVLIFLLILFRRKTLFIEWLLIGISIALAFSAVRNFSLFVFITFIPFARLLGIALKGINKKLIIFLCFLSVVLYLFLTVSKYGLGFGIVAGSEKAVDFLIEKHIDGPILNNFDIGSYLDYRLFPTVRVFVDGRPEAYPAGFFQKEYIPLQEDSKAFQAEDKKYHFQTIFWAHTDATPWSNMFLERILKDKSWKIIYLDPTVVILVKNTEKNAHISLSEQDYLSGKISLPVERTSLIQEARIFDLLSWHDAEIHALEKILEESPNDCPTLYNLIRLLRAKQNPESLIFETRFQNYCH